MGMGMGLGCGLFTMPAPMIRTSVSRSIALRSQVGGGIS